MKTTAIILAAGFSRRFGREKLMMHLHGKPIAAHVIDAVLGAGFIETILVYRNEEISRLAEGKNIKCVYNPDSADGMSSSVKCGVRNSSPTDAFIFFAGDQPYIDCDTINQLITAFKTGKGTIVVPDYGGRKGSPVIFSSEWKPQLEKLTGDAGGRSVILANPEKVYPVSISNLKAGMDIDTWEDYISHKPDKV